MRLKGILLGLLWLGVSLVGGHPADPSPELAKYTMFATDTIFFGNQAYNQSVSGQLIDTFVIPGPGYVGTNGIMRFDPNFPKLKKFKFATDLLIGSSGVGEVLSFPATLAMSPQEVSAGKTLSVESAPSTITNLPSSGAVTSAIVRKTISKPVTNSSDWYKKWTTDSFPSVNATQSGVTLTPGSYAIVNVKGANSTITLDCGTSNAEFYIRDLQIERWAPSKIIIKKEKDKFCRVFIGNSSIVLGEGFQLITQDDTDRGRVLVYFSGTLFESTNCSQIALAPRIDGSLVAPQAKVQINNFVQLNGQILAKSIEVVGAFNSTGFDFEPFITSNITVTPPSVYEDTLNKGNLDFVPVNHSNTVNLSLNLSETFPGIETATVKYKLLHGGTYGSADATDFDLAVSPFNTEQTISFNGQKSASFPIRIIDDTQYEPTDSFTVLIYSPSPSDRIKFPANPFNTDATIDTIGFKIAIVNDDPNNLPPTGYVFTRNSTPVIETQMAENTVIGSIKLTDPDGDLGVFTLDSVETISGTNLTSVLKVDDADIPNVSGATVQIGSQFNSIVNFENADHQTLTVYVSGKDPVNATVIKNSFTVTVSPWNDNKLQVKPDAQNVNEGSSATIDVLANDTPDADLGTNLKKIIGVSKDSVVSTTLSYVSVRGATVSTNGTQCTYNDGTTAASTEAPFTEVFFYTVRDTANYGYPTAHHDSVVRVTMTIVNQNDNTPVANAATVPAVFEGSSDSIAVTGTDADGDPLVIASVSGGTQGIFSMSSDKKSIIYTHTGSNESPFTDAGTFTLTDGTRISAAVAVTVAIKPINDNSATAGKFFFETNENTPKTGNAITGADAKTVARAIADADQPNPGFTVFKTRTAPASYKVVKNLGGFSISEDGSFSYSPLNGIIGTDTVVVTLVDSAQAPYVYGNATYDKVNSTMTDTLIFTINRVNAKPLAGSLSITAEEKGPGVPATIQIGSGKTVSDANKGDNLTLVSAVNRRTSAGSVALGTTASVSDGGNFTLTYTPTATATVELFADTIDYVVRDAAGDTAMGKIFVSIAPINDNPAVAARDSIVVSRGGQNSAFNVITNDSDLDRFPENDGSSNVLEATVKSVDKNRGSLTITKSGAVTFVHDAAAIGADSIIKVAYTLSDTTSYVGKARFNTVDTLVIKIVPDFSKNPPVLAQRSFAVTEKKDSRDSVVLSSIISDNDIVDGDAVTLTITNNDSYGAASFTGDVTTLTVNKANIGSTYLRYTYTDAAVTTEKFTGSFSISATDSRSPANAQGTDTENYSVAIDTLNDNIPVVAKKTVTVPFGKATTIPLPVITDSDEPALMNNAAIDSTITLGGTKGITTLPLHGTVTWVSASQFAYTPDINSVALRDSFEYQILDSLAYDAVNRHRVKAWVVIDLDQSSKDKPIAVDDYFTLAEDGTLNENVKTNDLKATVGGVANTGPALTTVTLVTAPTNHNGTFTLNADGTFTYLHKDEELFTDKFTYTVSDAGAKTSFEGTVYLTITPRNDKIQSIAANTGAVNEKDSVKVLVIDANDTDVDQYPSEPTNIVLTGVSSVPTYGTVKFDADKKSILYVVDPAKTGQLKKGEIKTDVFTVETSDSVTYDKPATHRVNNQVTITITGLNDNTPSGAIDLAMTVDENVDTTSAAGKTDTLDLSAIVTDADQDALTVEVTQGSTGTASVVPGTMKIAYKHNKDNEVFVDQFTYTVSDGVFKTSPKIVTVEILKKNDNKITAKNDSVTVSEKDTNQVNVSLNNTTDLDVETTLKYSVTNGTNGTATVDAYGVVTYVHTKNLELTAVLRDTVIVTVTDTVSYDPTVGNPVADTVFVTINPVNDHSPVIAVSDTIEVYEGKSTTAINLRALVSDADGETAKINFSTNAALGTVASPATDAVIYTHLGAEPAVLNGVYDQITFTASDADTTVTGSIVVRILNRNDTPANYLRDSYTGVENAILTVPANSGVLANDTDSDLPASENRLRAVFGTQAKNGKVTLAADGSFTYEPTAAGTEFAADSFSYILVDSATYDAEIHTSSAITVVLNLTNANDEKPVSANDTIDVIEAGKAVILRSGAASVLANDTDLDGDVLTATLLDSAKTGSLKFASDGTFEYVHNGSEIYGDAFTYVATDGIFSDTATVTIVIAPKAPVINGDSTHYLDLNADGSIDQIRVVFNHTVDLTKTTFSATWADASALVLGSAAFESATAKNTIVIPVAVSTQNKTSGAMQLSVVHGGFANQKDSVAVKDGAAPVIASGFYQVMGANALLTVTMSETMQWNSEVPFSFILNKKEVVVPVGATAPATGTSYAFALPATALAIAPNDSIFVNVLGAVSDGINVQANPNNIRRPFAFENNIASAIYLDTNSIADGKIDQIKLTSATGTAITDSTLLAGLASGLLLPRGLKFVSIVSDSNGCVVNVSDSTTIGKVSTAVTAADTLSTAGSISSINGGTIGKVSGLKILDGIAPVINSAWYQLEKRTINQKDTVVTVLTVLYSEPVKTVTASGNAHPFGFYDVSTKMPFTMELANDKENSFTVTAQSIDYVVDGDSIRIERNLAVYDTVGNVQEMSVWAPIRVSMDYGIELRILIYPQPLVLTRDDNGRVTAAELSPLMRDHYRFSENGVEENSGIAFVVEATGPLSPTGNHTATAQILDQTGNTVSDKFDFVFGTKEGGNLAGIAVWNGRNKTGRPVGAGSYLLAIEASVETDEGEKSRVIQKQFIKTVGVNVRE